MTTSNRAIFVGIAIATLAGTNAVLAQNGAIVAWGWDGEGQCSVPTPNTDFVAIGGGGYHSLGLKSDGSIIAWGRNTSGQCDVAAPNSNFVKVAGGGYHSLGLKENGSIGAWGHNGYGQCAGHDRIRDSRDGLRRISGQRDQ